MRRVNNYLLTKFNIILNGHHLIVVREGDGKVQRIIEIPCLKCAVPDENEIRVDTRSATYGMGWHHNQPMSDITVGSRHIHVINMSAVCQHRTPGAI